MSDLIYENNRRMPRFMLSIIYGFVFILLFDTIVAYSVYDKTYLGSIKFMEDEICSYQGTIELDNDNGKYTCKCEDNYYTINSIHDEYSFQCTKSRKRQIVALILHLFIPFGLHFFYLERYFLFVIYLLLSCTCCCGNCFRYATYNQENYIKNRVNFLFIIMFFAMALLYVINLILIATGKVLTDTNNQTLVNDAYLLFSFGDY